MAVAIVIVIILAKRICWDKKPRRITQNERYDEIHPNMGTRMNTTLVRADCYQLGDVPY
jgi:hypothetical protein